jgi:hypothetical protein
MTAFLWLLLVLAFTAWSVFMGLIVGDILKANRIEAEHERRREWHGR